MKGLYAICDLDFLVHRRVDPLAYAKSVLAARPAVVQLRAKRVPAEHVLQLLRALVPLTNACGTLLFANDRADLAVLAGAQGVHVGQDDLSLSQVRQFDPTLKVGVSTHTITQLSVALAERPTYVAFGPIFETQSKQHPDPVVGLDGLTEASAIARQASIPIVAIGGIGLNQLRELVPLVDMVAVISGLFPPANERHLEGAELLKAVTRIALQYQQEFAHT